jgi:(p)ppGpp synthase/HD superfamily hydrolase
MKKEWVIVLGAAQAAAKWHVNEQRKGVKEPYVNHLLEVAALVAEATGGKDPTIVVAALLHDAIEHQDVPRRMIADAFGEDVARLVEEVTDDKTLGKKERQRKQVQQAPEKSTAAKIIKLADKISNLRNIAACTPAEWSMKKRINYIKWARDVARGLAGASDWLEKNFEVVALEAERGTQIELRR